MYRILSNYRTPSNKRTPPIFGKKMLVRSPVSACGHVFKLTFRGTFVYVNDVLPCFNCCSNIQ